MKLHGSQRFKTGNSSLRISRTGVRVPSIVPRKTSTHCVLFFLFFVCAMEGARTGRRRISPQAISPVRCCLARGFQRVGMSTVEAVNRKISRLFCFSGRVCTLLHISCTLYKKAMKSLHRLHSVYFAAQKEIFTRRALASARGVPLRPSAGWLQGPFCL